MMTERQVRIDGWNSSVNSIVKERRPRDVDKYLPYVIVQYLNKHGYAKSAETLYTEAKLSENCKVCYDMDLEIIVQDFISYYHMKFGKYPKFCRISKTGEPEIKKTVKKKDVVKVEQKLVMESVNIGESSVKKKEPEIPKCTNRDLSEKEDFVVVAMPIFPEKLSQAEFEMVGENIPNYESGRVVKPVGNLYPAGSEWMAIAELISKVRVKGNQMLGETSKKEILLKDLNVHWADIKGLDKEKEMLKTAILLPIKHPSLFNNTYAPWKSVLLYGPPGTGKTMLAKAVATECKCTFFNITSSSITSKWRGDSEKYVRVLFDLANYYAPSVIFIDEIDWIGKAGSNSSLNLEPSRRFRAEFLARFDGLLTAEDSKVILLAATNLPWDIDTALLRRLEKRIYVGLPNTQTRSEILKSYLSENESETEQFKKLVAKTKDFSCADLRLLLKEVWMHWISSHVCKLEQNEVKIDKNFKDRSFVTVKYIDAMLPSVRPTGHNSKQYLTWLEKLDKGQK